MRKSLVLPLILLLLIGIFPSPGLILSEQALDLNFEVPGPPGADSAQTQNFRFGGRDILCLGYNSKADALAIKNYYCQFFQENGFSKVKEEELFGKSSFKQIRFKKDELVINIILASKPDQTTDVAISKYLQPQASPDLEQLKPSVKDSFLTLPAEDQQGNDLLIIPRPPKSVRLADLDQGKGSVTLVYTTELGAQETKEFYKESMPEQAWELEKEVCAGDLMEAYKKTAKKNINLPSPFSDGEDMNEVAAGAYQLSFKARFGKAGVSIMPNFMDKKLGSIVQINYTPAKDAD